MSTSMPQIFDNVTPQQFEQLAAKAQSAGIAIAGDTGTASKMGVEVTWNYSAQTQQLTLTCLKAPFFIGVHQVNEQIRSLVTQTLAA
jgi:transcription initiation factor TFIID subunit TAF12